MYPTQVLPKIKHNLCAERDLHSGNIEREKPNVADAT